MKKAILLLILLQFTVLFNGCSSDSGENTPDTQSDKNATITSYSKDFGTTGDTIKIIGENFPIQISNINITFDKVPAIILSATEREITFTLPATEKLLPKLVLTIENKTITNNVKNNYDKNIGILPMPSITSWVAIENNYKSDKEIQRIKMLSDEIIYYVTDDGKGKGTYRSLDGGITWLDWARNGFYGGFHATKNDEGWSGVHNELLKIPIGGYKYFNSIMQNPNEPISVYVDENMTTGTFITAKGEVYTTNDGLVFSKIYTSSINNLINGQLFKSAEIDNNHMWVIGYKNGGYGSRPFIVYKNSLLGDWKEYSFDNEPNSSFQEICFVDPSTGFLLINKIDISNYITILGVKLYKTTDGGDTWTPIYNGEKFTKFAFKDAMTGWAILDNKIYKTTDGGVAWTLDYTHDQPIRNIAYKNNVVWAISQDKILKRYL